MLAAAFNPEVPRELGTFLKKYSPVYPFGYASPDSVYGYLQLSFMQRNYVPDLVFIDRTGTIRAQYGGTDPFFKSERPNIRAKLDELLKESAAKPPPKKSAPKKT